MTLVGTMPRRQLARRLRQLRDHSGLTLHEVATRLEISTSTLSRLENAQVLVDIHLLKDMLDLYGLTIDRWDPYLSLCRQARGRGWWRDYGMDDRGYVALEASANLVREFAVMSIPGLLQTEAYARALFDDAVLPLPKCSASARCRSECCGSAGSTPRTTRWSWWPWSTRRRCNARSVGRRCCGC
jgi:transcriptional regulator with XRE-family HTH domain